jgi:hypothetical protein
MFGSTAKAKPSADSPSSDSSGQQSSALAQIRAALSSSKRKSYVSPTGSPDTKKALLLEADASSSESLLTRKIGSLTDPVKPAEKVVNTAYSMIPMWLFSWKTMLVLIILFGIIWIVRPYVTFFNNISSTLSSFMGESETPEAPQPTEAKEQKEGVKKIKEKVESKKKLPVAEEPVPDDSASSTQGGSQGGFCLAGEWKGIRTCVKVDSNRDCTSGQLFDNEAVCVDPTLRA